MKHRSLNYTWAGALRKPFGALRGAYNFEVLQLYMAVIYSKIFLIIILMKRFKII